MLERFASVFDASQFILGEKVKAFEQEYAKFNDVKYCVGVGNGLDALHLSLKALGVGGGDEVIIPSNTYIATALAVSHCGATPIFVEPRISTYNINPELIKAAITSKSKAIIPVNLYGQACELEEIMKIAKQYNLFVVEDNAQAQGATYNGKKTGSFGDCNATSFYPSKNLGALGDSGAVTTNSDALNEKVSMLHNYGSHKKYYHEVLGYNSRLDELQAALLSIKLKYLEEWNNERIKIAEIYSQLLSGVGDIVLPQLANAATCIYHLYVIRTKKRDALQKFLDENGIGTIIHYPVPPHLQNAYKSLGHKKGDFPIAEEVAETCISLPMFPGINEKDVNEVVTTIKKFYDK